METLLEVEDLFVSLDTLRGEVQAVRGVHFSLNKGETVAVVGESGCGKSVMSQALMRLNGRIKYGAIKWKGRDLVTITEKEMEKLRGQAIAMVFQDALSALNPTITVGKQIAEGLRQHQNKKKSEVKQRVIELLRLVGISNPELRAQQYPHQLSGGMRQRVMIAAALACQPQLLIADEPTTALDVTIQAQVIELLKELQSQLKMAVLFITHDLGIVAEMADRVLVMYAGMIVEAGTVEEIFYEPRHPYTWGLLASLPQQQQQGQPLISIPGSPPNLLSPPSGCPFVTRCPYAMKICNQVMPDLQGKDDTTHQVACWLEHPQAPAIESPLVKGGDV